MGPRLVKREGGQSSCLESDKTGLPCLPVTPKGSREVLASQGNVTKPQPVLKVSQTLFCVPSCTLVVLSQFRNQTHHRNPGSAYFSPKTTASP